MLKPRLIVLSLVLVGSVYAFKDPLIGALTDLRVSLVPCSVPITYSLGDFDPKFGMSRKTFLDNVDYAVSIWESASGRDLFNYHEDGSLKINLIYDYRQEATVALQKLGLTYGDDKASYDRLNNKYISLQASYENRKKAIDAEISDFNTKKAAYEKEVAYWNARGGAPDETYNKLNSDKIALDSQVEKINTLRSAINAEISDINALVVILNQLVKTLNLTAAKFNQIGQSQGSEFNEGIYRSSLSGKFIDIFQFDDRTKLIRVLAHELGHAIGLSHLDDPKAIMYRLNEGSNDKLSAEDLAALRKLCNLKAS